MLKQRPNSLPALLWLAARVLLRQHWRKASATTVAVLLGAMWFSTQAPECGEGTRVASFNIQDFPRSPQQVAGAFVMLGTMDADVVALQEITTPRIFAASAERILGAHWKFIYADSASKHKVGFLYDSQALELLDSRVHRSVATYQGGRPAFEALFKRREDGQKLRTITLHLKYGKEGRAKRQAQLKALAPIVKKAAASGDQVVVLGDFNATEEADRKDLEALAQQSGLKWASQKLRCTSYWSRPDGCKGTALDHVLTSQAPEHIAAGGPCESVGCDPGQQCPTFFHHVSDHCPVTVDLR